MKKKTPDIADQEISFTPDFIQIPSIVAFDKKLQPLHKLIYGVVFWLERLKDGKCFASNSTIAKVVGSSSGGVANGLIKLRDKNYITCLYDDKGQRKEIKTLVFNTVNPSSSHEGGVHHLMNRERNTNKEYTSEQLTNIKKVYVAWLRTMILSPDQRSITDSTLRKSYLQVASKRTRLSELRKTKINARIESMGLERVMMAVAGLARSDFHRGENDRKWKANLEWLCGNDEKIEEWADRYEGSLNE